MTPKPILGYASRTEAVIAMRASGMGTQAIAMQIGIKPSTVTALESSAGRSRRREAYSGDRRRAAGDIALSSTQREALRPSAAKRGLTVGALLTLLLDRIAEDRLVDAILDDEGVQYR